MRRHHLMWMPLLMTMYPGLKPWDLDLLTRDELDVLLRAAKEAVDG